MRPENELWRLATSPVGTNGHDGFMGTFGGNIIRDTQFPKYRHASLTQNLMETKHPVMGNTPPRAKQARADQLRLLSLVKLGEGELLWHTRAMMRR